MQWNPEFLETTATGLGFQMNVWFRANMHEYVAGLYLE